MNKQLTRHDMLGYIVVILLVGVSLGMVIGAAGARARRVGVGLVVLATAIYILKFSR